MAGLTSERQVVMEHFYTLELLARERIGDMRREADQHRLVRPTASSRFVTWPLLGRAFQLVVRLASPA
jgi:hypothetical protein